MNCQAGCSCKCHIYGSGVEQRSGLTHNIAGRQGNCAHTETHAFKNVSVMFLVAGFLE